MAKNDEDEILNIKKTTIGQRVRYEPEKEVFKRPVDTYDKLTTQQQVFVDTYLSTKDKKLAMQEAGYSEKTQPTNILNSPLVKEVVQNKREELWDRFKEYAELALQVQVDMLTNPKVSSKVKLDATNSILDRAGYKPADRKEIVGVLGTTPVESRAVNEFAQRARDLLKQRGLVDDDIVDAVIVEED